jgi:hypothetical protein
MGKGIARRVLTGKVMPKEHKPDGDTQGLPSGNRGQGEDNTGKSIRGFRVGRGAV